MKKLIIGFILISFFKGISQSPYELFNSKSEMFFGNPNAVTGSTITLSGLKPDSTKVIGGDSVYYHYRIPEHVSPNCYNSRGVNWMGKKTVRKTNGDFIFFNKQGDSIIIKTLAAVGTSWKYYTFPANSNYVLATVSQKTFMPTYGALSDTVKIITFQTYNSSDVAIYGSYNAQQFIISKQQGVIKMGNIYNFPTDTTLTQRYNGKRLKRYDIYNYEVGDEFHISGYSEYLCGTTYLSSWSATKVLGKDQVSPTSVTYTLYVQTVQGSFFVPPIINPPATYTVSFSNLDQYISPMMPSQFFTGHYDYYFDYCIFNYNTNCQSVVLGSHGFYDRYWGPGPNDTCTAWVTVAPLNPPLYCMENVSFNLSYNIHACPVVNGWAYVSYRVRNNTACGPIDWEVGLPENKKTSDVEIFPNPANDVLTIRYTEINLGNKLKLLVYDSQGKNILQKELNTENFENKIDINNFSKGLYLFSFISEGKTNYTKRIIKE